MKLPRPINIGYEIACYYFFVLLLLYVSWNHILGEHMSDAVWDYGIWGLPLALLLSITIRAVRISEERLTSSVLIFGFNVGSVLWALFSLIEIRSEGASFTIGMVIGILAFSCFTAFVAWIIAAILAKLLMRIGLRSMN